MKKTNFLLICIMLLSLSITSQAAVNKHILVGYWHNFNNGAANGLKLSQVDNSWDVINLSFAEPTSPTSGDLRYNPTADGIYSSEAEFKADVQAIQANGKKVILSIGGELGQVRLETTAARDKFIQTAGDIIQKYGLDGLDVDFEGNSLSLDANDYNFKNPTTPVVVNLIYALKALKTRFGADFMLTMAPETFFVQLGYSFYGSLCWGCDSRAGAYLPVIYAMRNDLNWLQVQYYNSGAIQSPEGLQQSGGEDFIVNLANMLLTGFEVDDPQNKVAESLFFPALRADQVVLGVPVGPGSAGSGVLTPEQYKSVFNKLRAKGHSNLRGLMTWSINWDVQNGKSWSSTLRPYINGLNGAVADTQAPTNPTNVKGTASSTSIALSWTKSTDNVGVTGYNIYVNGTKNGTSTSTSYTATNLTAKTAYSLSVEAYDGAGNKSAKASINVTTLAEGTGGNPGDGGGDTGSCDAPAYNPAKAYNVHGEEPGVQVSHNGKIYKLAAGQWAPVGAGPGSAWDYLWEFVKDCGTTGDTGGGDDNGDGNDNGGGDHTLTSCLKRHLVIGYWHNFNNGAADGLKLTEIADGYDFINVSFGETDFSDRAVITFVLDNSIYANDAAFIADIRAVQNQGKKVNLSLGGQNGIIHVNNNSDKAKFVNSVISIIDKYGFDGLDIDFEGPSAGGTSPSFDNPNTEAQLMIDGIREICDHYGDSFILTMAPETAYVQFGINQAQAPAYLTLIHNLRDKLTVLHVQHYNTGGSNDLYGNIANPGSADYHVAMAEMMLQGFPSCGKTFPALREDQVAFGVPATTSAAGSGYVAMAEVKKALKYLLTGEKSAGMNYTLKKPGGYPKFRGLMTWSVNWDKVNNNELANTFSAYFNSLGNPLEGDCGGGVTDTEAPTVPKNVSGNATSSSAISVSWSASSDNIAVRGYNIYVNGTKNGSSTTTSYNITGLAANTSYNIQVDAYDAAANKSAKSSGISVKTQEATGGDDNGDGGDNGGDTSECSAPAWDPTKNYQIPEEIVSYQGKEYKCITWWSTAGAAPDVTPAQWTFVKNCGTTGGDGDGNDGGGNDTGIDYENGKKFVVYFPNWGTYNAAHLSASVDMIPWSKVTHINHAFFTVSSGFQMVSMDEFADYDKSYAHSEGWDSADRLAGHMGEYKYFKSQYPNVKLLISVGGWTRGEHFHAMALTSQGRTTFINSIIAFLNKYPFVDGIDLDWEYPGVNRPADPNDSADKGCPGGPEDKVNFTLLLKEIRQAYNANGFSKKLLTIAASLNQETIGVGPSPADYHQYLDFINIMSYDVHGAFERVTNHHSPLYANPNDPSELQLVKETFNAHAAGEFFSSFGIPKSKLTIGSPWYSRGWGGVSAGPNGDGLFQPATGYERGSWDDPTTPAPGGQYPWFHLKELETTPGWIKKYDNISKAAYLFNPSTGVFLTYEDEQSLTAKCDYINEKGYGGLIVWEITGDALNDGAPLTTLVYNKLLKDKGIGVGVDVKTTASISTVYPNPASDYLNIQLSKDALVSIYDMSGKTVFNSTLEQGDNVINVGGYLKGLYLIKIMSKDVSTIEKVMIK